VIIIIIIIIKELEITSVAKYVRSYITNRDANIFKQRIAKHNMPDI